MALDSSSFWADIKKFEDTLAKDPSSYCFAPLAELYRKTGLLDDAIATAQKGTAMHPQYVGGYMALGRAYLDKGMKAEALEALQRVVSFTPENMLAQKLLCQIYIDSGDNGLLRKSLEALLSLNPLDTESRILLESLERTASDELQAEYVPEDSDFSGADFLIDPTPGVDSAESLEELDLLDEIEEVIDETPPWLEAEIKPNEESTDFISNIDAETVEDDSMGIRTATIAELYVAQGHADQAIDIYRELLVNTPGNQEFEARISELERLISEKDSRKTMPFADPWGGGDRPLVHIPAIDEVDTVSDLDPESASFEKNDSLALLQDWLDNIRRIKECRSGRG